MIEKLKAFWDVLQVGRVVADPAKWKNRQITVTLLTGVLWAVANLLATYGITLPIDRQAMDTMAAGVLAFVNVVLTVATSDKVGLRPRPAPDPP